MPFVLGSWWDDYKYQVFKYADIKEHMVSAGRLDAYYMLMPVNRLPIWMFRVLVVILYMISAVLIYLIVAQTFENLQMAFGIGILYNAIPVNDVRLMKCVYPYTLSVCMFLTATYLLIRGFKRRDYNFEYITRIGCCILFLISFSMNSLLFYYIIPVALLWYCIAKETICKGEKRDGLLFVQKVMEYWDLYIIPFAYFAIKKLFLQPDSQGLYANYNSITIEKCLNAIKILPDVFVNMLVDIVKNQYATVERNNVIIIIFGIIFALFFCGRKKIVMQSYRMNLKQKLACEAVGIIITMCGLYPYVVIRQSRIESYGVGGRDAILVCLGISIMFFGILEIICAYDWIKFALSACILVVAFFHFTYYYSGYMRDYYNYAMLQQKWLQTDAVEKGNTYIDIRNKENQTVTECFYMYNAMATEVYGNSKRFISEGINDLYFLTEYDKKELMKNDIVYGYSEYNLDDIKIDGIMIVTYNMKENDALRLRLKEVLTNNDYSQQLEEYIDYRYIPITQEESSQILQSYLNKEIQNNDELLMLINEFQGNK